MFKNTIEINIDSKELFSKRNEDGYIILDEYIKELPIFSREAIGNDKRTKNWIKTSDGRYFLIKTNAKLYDKENYLEYSELICESIAQMLDIPYVNYDIISLNNEKGVICECAISDNEYMVTLEDFISSSNCHAENPDIIDLENTIRKFKSALKCFGKNETEIKQIILDFQKILILDVLIGNADRHLENISLILNTKSNDIKFSPLYDSENSLLLENDIDLIKEMALDRNICKEASYAIVPKIALVPKRCASAEQIVYSTVDMLIEMNNDLEDFILNIDAKKFNLIKEKVESKIKSSIPFEVDVVSRICLSERLNMINIAYYEPDNIDYDFEYMENMREYIKNEKPLNHIEGDYIVKYKGTQIGKYEARKEESKYEVKKENLEKINDNIYYELKENSKRKDFPFLDNRILNSIRFKDRFIGYHTDPVEIVRI